MLNKEGGGKIIMYFSNECFSKYRNHLPLFLHDYSLVSSTSSFFAFLLYALLVLGVSLALRLGGGGGVSLKQ